MESRKPYIDILTKFILPIYLLSLGIFVLFRLVFIIHFFDSFSVLYETTDELYRVLAKSLAVGVRYDNIVVAYITAIPLLVLFVAWILKLSLKPLLTFLKGYFIAVYAIVFALSSMDIPYFEYFWTHPTVVIFDWIGFGGTYGMLVQESSYYPYYLLYAITLGLIILATYFCGKWVARSGNTPRPILNNKYTQTVLFILALVLCFFSTRGQLKFNKVGLSPSHFSGHVLVSDFCITPAYHFVLYMNDYQINLDEFMDTEEAIASAQKYLKVDTNSQPSENPISRSISVDSTQIQKDYNIVLIFMESMGTSLLHQSENGIRLTPYLDSLTQSGYYFENIYSSGIHTNAGVGSTLISQPCEPHRHMMDRNPLTYKSVLSELKEIGYSTSFFLPNDEAFDNMGLFLRANHIDTIFSDKIYPKEEIANNFGVPDHYLLDFALNGINQIAQKKSPFFSAILTVSNHPPYVVPEPFAQISKDKEKTILAYTDHSIKEFMENAAKQEWYTNTVFVLVADHGKRTGSTTHNKQLEHNHIPLIIFSPTFSDMPKVLPQYGGQIDVMPTVMGLINRPYTNSTMGVDLLKEKRPYMFFTSDTYVSCIDDDYFYLLDARGKKEYLYSTTIDAKDIIEDKLSETKAMKEYALSMLITTSHLRKSKLAEK